MIQQHMGPPSLGDKVKIFICGRLPHRSVRRPFQCLTLLPGPPGQVAAVAGKKDGMKQGEVGGILKELGYKEDQVGERSVLLSYFVLMSCHNRSSNFDEHCPCHLYQNLEVHLVSPALSFRLPNPLSRGRSEYLRLSADIRSSSTSSH